MCSYHRSSRRSRVQRTPAVGRARVHCGMRILVTHDHTHPLAHFHRQAVDIMISWFVGQCWDLKPRKQSRRASQLARADLWRDREHMHMAHMRSYMHGAPHPASHHATVKASLIISTESHLAFLSPARSFACSCASAAFPCCSSNMRCHDASWQHGRLEVAAVITNNELSIDDTTNAGATVLRFMCLAVKSG